MIQEYQQIIQQINSKKLSPVYFLEGEEPYYIDALIKQFETNVLAEEEKDFNLIELYGKDIEVQEVISAARRYPMFAEKILVIVKDGASLKNIDLLEGYIQNPSPSTILVIEYRYKKLDKRSKLSKSLKNNAVSFSAEKLKEQQIPGWIMQFGVRKGFEIPTKEAEMLAVYLGNDLQKIDNEVAKILINEPQLKQLSADLIEKYIGISKEYNIFDLPTVIFTHDANRLARMMAYFTAQPKNAPMAMVVGTLYNYISKLYLCFHTTASFESDRKAGIWSTHREVAQQYHIAQIHQCIALLEEMDHKSKGVNSAGNDTSLLKELVGKIQLIISKK